MGKAANQKRIPIRPEPDDFPVKPHRREWMRCLRRRKTWLQRRVSAHPDPRRGLTFDMHELNALLWAIAVIEAMYPELKEAESQPAQG